MLLNTAREKEHGHSQQGMVLWKGIMGQKEAGTAGQLLMSFAAGLSIDWLEAWASLREKECPEAL